MESAESQSELSPLLVDERTAAKMLGICGRKLFDLAKSGAIPFVKIGKAKRYAVAALVEFIKRQGGAYGQPQS